jgi:hypothetical protein
MEDMGHPRVMHHMVHHLTDIRSTTMDIQDMAHHQELMRQQQHQHSLMQHQELVKVPKRHMHSSLQQLTHTMPMPVMLVILPNIHHMHLPRTNPLLKIQQSFLWAVYLLV